jgi:hypothetical protein
MKKRRWVISGIAVAVCAFACFAWLKRGSYYWIRIADESSLSGIPSFAVLNPFRDKKAERCINSLFEALAQRRHEEAYGYLMGASVRKDQFIADESAYPAVRWKLVDITRNGQEVEYCYLRYRKDSNNAIVTRLRVGSDMKITSFESVY